MTTRKKSLHADQAERREILKLIAIVEAGAKAYDTIGEKYPGKVELCRLYQHISRRWRPIVRTTTPTEYRIVEAPVFAPFKIGEGQHKVSFDGSRIHVGCKRFNPEVLLSRLRALAIGGARQNVAIEPYGEFAIFPNRNGVWTHEGEATWAEVETLIKALKKLERKAA